MENGKENIVYIDATVTYPFMEMIIYNKKSKYEGTCLFFFKFSYFEAIAGTNYVPLFNDVEKLFLPIEEVVDMRKKQGKTWQELNEMVAWVRSEEDIQLMRNFADKLILEYTDSKGKLIPDTEIGSSIKFGKFHVYTTKQSNLGLDEENFFLNWIYQENKKKEIFELCKYIDNILTQQKKLKKKPPKK